MDVKGLKSWHEAWCKKQNAPWDSQSDVSPSSLSLSLSLSDDDDDDETIGIEVVHSWSAEECNALVFRAASSNSRQP